MVRGRLGDWHVGTPRNRLWTIFVDLRGALSSTVTVAFILLLASTNLQKYEGNADQVFNRHSWEFLDGLAENYGGVVKLQAILDASIW